MFVLTGQIIRLGGQNTELLTVTTRGTVRYV